MKPHHNLECWKKGIELSKQVYKLTKNFPADEKFGITSQMRRASVSIVLNIAEGAARQSKVEFIRFLHIANGSASELDTLFILCRELEMIDDSIGKDMSNSLDQVTRLIIGLRNSLSK